LSESGHSDRERPLRPAERIYLRYLLEEAGGRGRVLEELLADETELAEEIRWLDERRNGILEESLSCPPLPRGLRPGEEETEAIDPALERTLEVRVGERDRDEVLREAWIRSRLEHPGVAPVHEAGTDAAGRPFFTSGAMHGSTLAELLRGNQEVAIATHVERLSRVADTLQFAHDSGIVHGALETESVLFGEFGEVILTGWDRASSTAVFDAEALTPRVHDGLDFGDGTVRNKPREGRADPSLDLVALGALLAAVLEGAYPDGRRVPAELSAIRDRASVSGSGSGYAEPAEVAEDLRSWLDHRVVLAHAVGPIAELRAFARRNREVVGLLLGAVVLLSAILGWSAWEENRDLQEIRGLSSLQEIEDWEADEHYESFWPPSKENRERINDWLKRARSLAKQLPEYQLQLNRIRAEGVATASEVSWAENVRREHLKASPSAMDLAEAWERSWTLLLETGFDPGDENCSLGEEGSPLQERRKVLYKNVLDAEDGVRIFRENYQEFAERFGTHFEDRRLAWRHEALIKLIDAIERLSQDKPLKGNIADFSDALARLDHCLAASLTDTYHSRWSEARDAIAADPRYGGLSIQREFDLVPLRKNPEELYEFAHLLSGSEPVVGADKKLEISEENGIVLVLLPGGELGSRKIEPFFISKFEVTQAQWARLRKSCSFFTQKRGIGAPLHPLEHVKWNDARLFTLRLGLELPSEEQWEYAARGGKEDNWWNRDEEESEKNPILRYENLHGTDRSSLREVALYWRRTLPVGSLRPNPFGLFDMMGNVAEWCRGEADPQDGHVARGGAHNLTPDEVGFETRRRLKVNASTVGLRPVRRVRHD
jgi:hypothetical protein